MATERILKVADVFKSIGKPTTTYVKREAGRFEKRLTSAVEERGRICLLTGSSKTGKTTLYVKVLEDLGLEPLVVRCDTDTASSEFWKRSLEQVDFERLSSRQTTTGTEVSGAAKVAAKLGWTWLAGVTGEASVGMKRSDTEDESRQRILAQPSPDHLVPILKNLPTLLVIEDFHYLKPYSFTGST